MKAASLGIVVSGWVSVISDSEMTEWRNEFTARPPSEVTDVGCAPGAQDEIVRGRRKFFRAIKRKCCGVVPVG
jgi:hypothetical protein